MGGRWFVQQHIANCIHVDSGSMPSVYGRLDYPEFHHFLGGYEALWSACFEMTEALVDWHPLQKNESSISCHNGTRLGLVRKLNIAAEGKDFVNSWFAC